MSEFGIDWAWGNPSIAALHAAGVKFAARYLSHDSSKNLSPDEAKTLSAAGIWIVVIWETTANRALSGYAGGVADATEAAKQAKACGMPADRPIYFAVDWDATPGQQGEIHTYLDGAASVLTRARVGLYAGYGPIKRAFDAKKITFGWQTYGWSGGKWDSRAQFQQYLNSQRVGGVDCDFNRAVKADYGQWRVGVSPQGEIVTPQDIQAIAEAVVKQGYNARGDRVGQALQTAKDGITTMLPLVQQLAKSGGVQVDEAAIVQGVLAGLSPAAIAAAVESALPADMAHQVVDELAARLGGK